MRTPTPFLPQALLAAGLLAAAIARAQPATVEPEAAEQPRTTDLGKGAEEVAARLRELMRSLGDTAAFAELEAEVAAHTHRAAEYWDETGRLLARGLRTTALDSLTTSWGALRSDLEDVNGRIETRVRRREADIATLTALRDSWTRARELATAAEAPPAVLERIGDTLAAIDRARPAIEQRRGRVLVLQDSVSRALQTCDDALAQLSDARREAVRRAFSAQEPPLWHPVSEASSSAASSGSGGSLKLENLRMYVAAYRGRLVASGLIILLLMILLRRAGAQLGDPTMSIVRTPYAAALLVGALVTRPLRPNPTFEFQQAVLLIGLIATVLILRPVLRWRPAALTYVSCGAFVVYVVGQLLEPTTRPEQILLVAEMGVTAAALFWATAPGVEWVKDGEHARVCGRPARRIARLLGLGCGGAAIAAAFGYLDLSDFLGVACLSVLLLGIALLAARIALVDLITVGLSRGPLARLHTVGRHRALIDQRIRGTTDVALVAFWVWVGLARFQLLDPVGAVVRGVLDTRLQVGQLDLPVAHVLAFVAVVIAVFLTTRVVGTILEDDVYSRMTLPRGVPYALSTLTRYAFLLVGFLLALATLGLDLTRITVLVSALGLGLGFGLQQIMNNFVSGLILLFERPVNVGDSIEMNGLSGNVLRIGIRSSTVHTSQGAEVIVPNSKMIEEKVTNWTLSDRRRRIDLDIGVKGDVDAGQVLALLTEIAGSDPRVLRIPPPEALLVRFGADATDFQLRFWTDDPRWTQLRSDLSVTLQRTLRAVRVVGGAPT